MQNISRSKSFGKFVLIVAVQYYSSTTVFLDRLKSLPTNRDPDTPYALQESQGESFDNVNK